MATGITTLLSVVDNGSQSYTLTLTNVTGIQTDDHVGARINDGSGAIYRVTAVSSPTITVQDDLIEAETGPFGVPDPTIDSGKIGYGTPTTSDLTQLPYSSPGWDAAGRRNNAIIDGNATYVAKLDDNKFMLTQDWEKPSNTTTFAELPPSVRRLSWNQAGTFVAASNASVTSPFIYFYRLIGDSFYKLPDPVQPPNAVLQARFSPNNEFCATGHLNSPFVTIYQVNGNTFTKVANPNVLPPNTVYSMGWSPDSTYLAVGHSSGDRLTIYERDGTTFTKITGTPDISVTTAFLVTGAQWSPDGGYLAVSYDDPPYLSIYRQVGTTFTEVYTGVGSRPETIVWSPDGKFLVCGVLNSPYLEIYSFENETLTLTNFGATDFDNSINWIDWSLDGRYLAICSVSTEANVRIYEYLNDEITLIENILLSEVTSNNITALAWSPDNKYLLVGGTDQAIGFVDIFKTTADPKGDSFLKTRI